MQIPHKNTLHEKLRQREFTSFQKKGDSNVNYCFNLEFAIKIDDSIEKEFNAEGNFFPGLERKISIYFEGYLVTKPINKHTPVWDQNVYEVSLEYYLKDPESHTLTASNNPIATRTLEQDSLEPISKQYFPDMGLLGEIKMICSERLPPNITKEEVLNFFKEGLGKNRYLQKVSEAYKSFRDTFIEQEKK
ncbi:MAG: hypothetical protein KKF89_00645 [Nanoarchaeota archaeon]|nr:hypothetical protein [Nanoarchaeota archaeon]MBU1854205.1 hypothetical protein [Nanoarchaeota archaeon]